VVRRLQASLIRGTNQKRKNQKRKKRGRRRRRRRGEPQNTEEEGREGREKREGKERRRGNGRRERGKGKREGGKGAEGKREKGGREEGKKREKEGKGKRKEGGEEKRRERRKKQQKARRPQTREFPQKQHPEKKEEQQGPSAKPISPRSWFKCKGFWRGHKGRKGEGPMCPHRELKRGTESRGEVPGAKKGGGRGGAKTEKQRREREKTNKDKQQRHRHRENTHTTQGNTKRRERHHTQNAQNAKHKEEHREDQTTGNTETKKGKRTTKTHTRARTKGTHRKNQGRQGRGRGVKPPMGGTDWHRIEKGGQKQGEPRFKVKDNNRQKRCSTQRPPKFDEPTKNPRNQKRTTVGLPPSVPTVSGSASRPGTHWADVLRTSNGAPNPVRREALKEKPGRQQAKSVTVFSAGKAQNAQL
jgi:hypothetical protein